MYICSGTKFDGCDVQCEHWKFHESINCCNEQSIFCKKVRNIVRCVFVNKQYVEVKT